MNKLTSGEREDNVYSVKCKILFKPYFDRGIQIFDIKDWNTQFSL